MIQSQSPAQLATESEPPNLPPQDLLSDNVLRILYLIIGAGTLFAYNTFISCTDYYNAINPTARNVSGQMATYQLTSMFIVSIALLPFSTSTSTSTLARKDDHAIVTTKTEKARIRNMKRFILRTIDLYSPAKRVLYGFSFTFLFLLAYLLLPPSAMTGSTLNLFSTFVGIADAMSQSGLYVLAANYDKPTLTASATLGGALSGLTASFMRLATRGMFDTESVRGLRRGADLLIWLAFGFTVVLIGSTLMVQRDLQKRQQLKLIPSASASIRSPDDELAEHSGRAVHVQAPLRTLGAVYSSAFLLTWKPIVSAFLNFFITLALFPGVTLDIPSTNGTFSLGNWLPVVLIAIFNGADCAGRFILGSETMIPFRLLMARVDTEPQMLTQIVDSTCTERTNIASIDDRHSYSTMQRRECQGHQILTFYNQLVWFPTFGRIIFFPLLSMCILPSDAPIIGPDISKCILVFLFGVSNGFIHCGNFTVAPTLVDTEEAKNAVAMLLLLAIYSGLCLGAFFGLLVEKVIRNLDR